MGKWRTESFMRSDLGCIKLIIKAIHLASRQNVKYNLTFHLFTYRGEKSREKLLSITADQY